MNKLAKAVLGAEWGNHKHHKFYQVQYNPTELSLDKGVQLAEINIPGLDAPLQQFVRGQAEKLSLELFFDTTEDGMGARATPVTAKTDQIYQLAKVDSETHAPPKVTFTWNRHFPGSSLDYGDAWTNFLRNSFTGVVESVKQKFTLFSPEGIPLRATVNLVLREYRPLEEQLKQLKLSSPDRTRSHVLGRGETLSAVAAHAYDRPGDWRRIADANGIEDPRRLTPGTLLTIPTIK
ncbi:MAG: LysM peptidoglycan-binding domain-containing protein [bacterium]|nr:LysM peptidoglycan-binding domain-containing protein [bacterium]